MPQLSRRHLLQLAAGALVTQGCDDDEALTPGGVRPDDPVPAPADGAEATAFSPGDIPQEDTLFPLGVQAGAMRPTSALLWAYRDDPSMPCTLRVWRESDLPGQVLLHTDRALPEGERYLRVEVQQLAPGQRYRYAFFRRGEGGSLERRSALGRFTTAFEAGAVRKLLLGASTCTSFSNAPYESLRMLASEEPDLFLHLGDISYNDGARTPDEFREKWRQTLADPGYRAILSACGFYATWDDHEVVDSSQYNPETMPPELLKNGLEAFFETLAVERGPGLRLWRSYRWGATAEFFILDSRTERRPSTASSGSPVYLGPEQMAWLKQALADSPCHFKILLNSVPMTDLPGLWELASGDRWEGYRVQRDELLAWLEASGVKGVYFLSGDFHCGFVARVDGDRAARWEIAVGPGASGPNPLPLLADKGTIPREEVFPSGQFIYGSSSRAAMTTLLLDPRRDRIVVRFVEAGAKERGKELFNQEI